MKHATLKNYKKLLSIVAVFFASDSVFAQPQNKNIHEEVYLHLNTTLFLAGETMFFTAYCVSANTYKLSAMSRIMYVELLDAENKPVFQTKISLDNGVGYGEYFINSLLTTGQYTLVAYTRWMRNFGDFFYQPITIINPFEEYYPPEKAHQVLASFYPEGGTMIEGAANTVVCHVRNEHGDKLNLSGRLVNSRGEKILDFSSGPFGIDRFIFTPEKGEAYQMILEDEAGAFHFFKLTEPVKGVIISITKKGSQFTIETKCSPSLNSREALLELKDRQNTFAQRAVNFGSEYVFNQSDFPQGTLSAVLKTPEGELLSQRPLYLPGNKTLSLLRDHGAVYARRQKVSLVYDIGPNANLSISVRKKNLPVAFERAGIANFIEIIADLKNENIDGRECLLGASEMFYEDLLIMSTFKKDIRPYDEIPVKLLPEYRHDLIEGYLVDRDDQTVPDKFLCLSLPGKDYQIATAKTDETGRFLIPLIPHDGDRLSFLKVPEEDSFVYNIKFIPEFREDYPPFNHKPVVLDSQSVAAIVQKSIYTQIENAYFDLRSPVKEMRERPFHTYFNYDREFFLDDYTRFPSMREVFHEYIPLVNVSKSENDFKLSYRLVDLPQKFLRKDLLILLEGVPISTRQALTLDPYKIESISLANNRYYIGPYIADGVISLHTYEGDLYGTELDKTTFKYNYVGIQPKRIYHFPDYERSSDTKFPDKREQLFWAPQVNVQEGEPLKLEFFTSDVTGNYQIDIEGVNDRGELISIREYFSVR